MKKESGEERSGLQNDLCLRAPETLAPPTDIYVNSRYALINQIM